MQWFVWKRHPFRLLLYLEWILLGIALVMVFSPHPPPHPHLLQPPPLVDRPTQSPFLPPDHAPQLPPSPNQLSQQTHFPLVGLVSIGILGLLGLRLPTNSPRLWQVFYTTLGFGLSWLSVLFNEQREGYFPPLLLVVVIRACLLFSWRGRLLVAAFAYGSFLLMTFSLAQKIQPPDFPPGTSIIAPKNPDNLTALSQHLVTNLIINSALMFGLVLVFVLLLVGSLLAERQSRQELALANSHLRQYALLIEDQAILQERNRIAREIHDSLGHSLTAQSIQLEYVSMLLPKDIEQADQHLQTARRLGKEALQSVRQSVGALRIHLLRGQSLTIALTKLLQEFEKTTGIQVKSDINLLSLPSEEVATALYRITQEALTNSSKYSQATQVQLHLTDNKVEISLRLEDNGRGFDPEANTTGFGLQGMRERAEALGGNFLLRSQLNQGCQIQIHIPLRGRKRVKAEEEG